MPIRKAELCLFVEMAAKTYLGIFSWINNVIIPFPSAIIHVSAPWPVAHLASLRHTFNLVIADTGMCRKLKFFALLFMAGNTCLHPDICCLLHGFWQLK